MTLLSYVYLIPLLPLATSAIVLFFGEEGPESKLPYLSTAVMGWCFIQASVIFALAAHGSLTLPYTASWDWFQVGDYSFRLGLLIDGPAATMLVVVTLVGFLVQLYSIGYMHGDPRFKRFYAYLSFFTASMLGLVVTSNLFIFFTCWELMGLSSYLLIGFWFEKPGPAFASKKAFITTKMGDLSLYLGMLLLFAQFGTFDLVMLKERAAMGAAFLPVATATALGLLFLGGSIGKSAQWPLFIWLPDAMEGPTPVSALIHAATMVAAGIYLVARTYFIYQVSPIAMEAVAGIGLLTAFMAASMAIVCYDIKRVLAFSTISQLGYMLLALGAGGYEAGLFHLTTHAFFKALLFLGAGSVIHAVHTNDMREMGGLSKRMPATFVTMLLATAAIAGVPPFAGFYSKEAILKAVYEYSPWMWAVAVATAGITTFYMCRMLFMTFLGEARDSEKFHHAHESPGVMTVPLWILGVLSFAAGFLLEHGETFSNLVHLKAENPAEHVVAAAAAAAPAPLHPWFLLPAAMAMLVVGVASAWALYGRGDFSAAESIKTSMSPVFTLLDRRYFFDDFWFGLAAIGNRAGQAAFWFDDKIVDRIFVDGWALVTLLISEIYNFFDAVVVDGLVDLAGVISRFFGWMLSARMDGQVQEYLLIVAFAVLVFFAGHWILTGFSWSDIFWWI